MRRRGRHLKPAELRKYIARRLHRLDDRSILVGRAVCRESLSRRRRPNRQRDLGRVIEFARRNSDLESRGASFVSRDRETHLGTVVCFDDDAFAQTAYVSSPTVRKGLRDSRIEALTYVRATDTEDRVGRADRNIDGHVLISLILNNDRQIDLVAEVHKSWGAGAHHQRLFGSDRRFSFTEPLASIDRDRRNAVSRQIVGELDIDDGSSVRIGLNRRRE